MDPRFVDKTRIVDILGHEKFTNRVRQEFPKKCKFYILSEDALYLFNNYVEFELLDLKIHNK